MNFYSVYIDNGLDYEDYTDRRYIIIATSEKEAEEIAKELWLEWYEMDGKNVTAKLMTKSDNGIPLNI